jgi:hypothetical protein
MQECIVECHLREKQVQTLEAAIELLSGLFFMALILVIAFCIVGSVAAALRAVSQVNCHIDKQPRRLATPVLHHQERVPEELP